MSDEVREALQSNKPVVALETAIYTHGFPYPENIALSSQVESVVRVNGGIPATIGVLNGVAKVGFSAEELIELAASAGKESTRKVSRRDLGYICGLVKLRSGSLTVVSMTECVVGYHRREIEWRHDYCWNYGTGSTGWD